MFCYTYLYSYFGLFSKPHLKSLRSKYLCIAARLFCDSPLHSEISSGAYFYYKYVQKKLHHLGSVSVFRLIIKALDHI